MNKLLLLANLVLLVAVVFLATRYHAARDLYSSLSGVEKAVENRGSIAPDCRYPLDAFDFHFKRETDKPNIVMFGNSLIRRGNWPKLLGREDVINRGIGGDNMECLAQRVAYLKGIDAKAWIIEGGINDFPMKKPGDIFEYYRRIIEFVRGRGAKPILSLVLHISPKARERFPFRKNYVGINKLIDELNAGLRRYAASDRITFIDPNSKLTDSSGFLRADCTVDGVHLTPKGYKIWAEQIKAALSSLNI